MSEHRSLGDRGEKLALQHLENKGYTIINKNWRSGKREIDIIAEDDDFIVFIEVKTRTIDYQLHPRDAVSVPKQRNIIFAATNLLERNPTEKEVRFDIISIVIDGRKWDIEHIIDAFYPTL